MKYRKQKKILKKQLSAAIKYQDDHFLSNSAKARVTEALQALLALKRNKRG